MKKKVILLSLLIVVIAVCFIPVSQQKTVLITGSFFNIIRLVNTPAKWKAWRTDLRAIPAADTNKITIKKDTNSFQLMYDDVQLNVKTTDGSFDINDHSGNGTINYNYLVLPDKKFNKTLVTVTKNDNVIKYLVGKLSADPFADTHVSDLKTFVETDSLFYGYKINKIRVPAVNLIVIDRKVLAKDKFTELSNMLTKLQQYIQTHDIKQVQPLISQCLLKGKDSAQLKVGIFVDKKITSDGEITYNKMPKNGVFYIAKYNGEFADRQKAYLGLQQYFNDHLYQSALLPFEIYIDNKFPTSDTDRINVQVVFPSYF